MPQRGAQLLNPLKAPLKTAGRYIVDSGGERVKWACINWYGAYSSTHAVGGLEVQPMDVLVQRIVAFGFNCVRMMYSTQGWLENPVVANSSLAANPGLMGIRFLDLFDVTVRMLTNAGLMVIVNNHVTKDGWCCYYQQDEGLWYSDQYSESTWIQSLVFFAQRYKGNPLVVAMDIRNEVHDYKDTLLTWGDGDPKTDWAAAASRAGNAVLQVNSDMIIVVMSLCFGADLRPMMKSPVQLMYPNRVVYQVHNYMEYQSFEAVSQAVAPWSTLRNWMLLPFFICLGAAVLPVVLWHRLGRPKPSWHAMVLTLGGWLTFFASITSIASWESYSLKFKFCSVGARVDMLPYFVGSMAMVGLGVGLIVAGLFEWPQWIFIKAKLIKDDSGGVYSPAASCSPTIVGNTLEADGPSVQNIDCEAVKPVREHSQTRPSLFPVTTRRSCVPGWTSCRFAYQRCWRYTEPKDGEDTHEVPWDCGLCCGLQVVVSGTFVVLFLIVLYIFAHIFPTYWWLERQLDSVWGFALQENKPYTAPVWVGEFGTQVRGNYWLNFVRYLSARDVDFAYWAFNGLKLSQGYMDTMGNFISTAPTWYNESYGLLESDYAMVRHPWKLLDLQALMESPARWRPETYPCEYTFNPACGG